MAQTHLSLRPLDQLSAEHPDHTFLSRCLVHRKWYKPIGFWYAEDAAWLRYVANCQRSPYHGRLAYLYTVDLGPSHIFRVERLDESISFFHTFVTRFFAGESPGVRWDRLAKLGYDGIEIGEEVFKTVKAKWLQTWDVPSGCIWNPKHVTLTLDRTVWIENKEHTHGVD